VTVQRDHLGMADPARASDADRESAVRDLTKHCGDGRLTLDELEDRIAEAYAATTKIELQHALRELPSAPVAIPTFATTRPDRPTRVPVARTPSDLEKRRAGEIALRIHLIVYLSVIGMLIATWFLTSPFGYFWPVWTAVPWGMALTIHAGVHKAVWHGHEDS
jgi:hypothetical protein